MPRLFGTNGVRGVVGETMTEELALSLGRALGTWLRESPAWPMHAARPRVLVGRDARGSGAMLSAAVSAGILASGVDVLDAGVASTPALQYAVKERPGLDAGVVVTASHNPSRFNGIKFCRGDGREMVPDEEEEVEAILFARRFNRAPWDDQGTLTQTTDVVDRYVAATVARVDRDVILAARPTVAVDTANGAASEALPRILAGIGCRVVSLNAHADGAFPGHPSEPTEEHAGDLATLVERHHAICGVMVDGDGDRAVFLDENGTFVPGEKSLALLAERAVLRAGGGTVCTPVSSSSVVQAVVENVGGQVIHTVVGSPKVAAAMVKTNAVLGGEENGGVIFPDHQHTRDAGITAARMVQLLMEEQRPLSELVARLPGRTMTKRRIEVPDEEKQRVMAQFLEMAKSGSLPGGLEAIAVDETDGVKVVLEGGWVLVRPSGTEPMVRVYAEAPADADAVWLADSFMEVVARLAQAKAASA
jgi:phosphomannomutase / phosphoglucomutase